MRRREIQHIGRMGEKCACYYLLQHGFVIFVRNYHTRFGELDIVAKTPDGQLVFVEVKARKGLNTTPESSITRRKLLHLHLAAKIFITRCAPAFADNYRFDSVAVHFLCGEKIARVRHCVNISP